VITTEDTLQSLWRYMDSRRSSEPVDACRAVLALARGEIPGDLTPEVLKAVIQQAATPEVGEFVSPQMICQFMADLASITKPSTVLDPACGSGLMLHQVIVAHKPNIAEGIELNDESCEIAAALLKGKATITLGNVLDATDPLQVAYDLVVADPSLGVHIQPTTLPPSLKGFALRDMAQNLAAWACDRLAQKGVLAIVMSPLALQHRPFIDAVHAAGCRIRAALHVPRGIRLNTSIPAQVLVIDHGAQEEIFVGQLSDEPAHRKRLLQNFQHHKSDRHPSLGRTIQLDQFISFEALEAEHLLRQKVRNTFLKRTSFAELVKVETRIERELFELDDEGIPDNALLVSQSGTRLTRDVFNLPPKDDMCSCLVLDETKVHADYLMRWIESDLGRLALLAAGGISMVGVPRFKKNVLNRLICYLPPIESQSKILEALRDLDRLHNEAKEIEAQCWTGDFSGEEILRRAKTINHEDRYEDWLATLPFPLASVLWRHRVSGEDPRIRFGVLLHFFEALAEFLATIHLSAFKSHAAVWDSNHGELLDALAAQNLTLQRATFGTWKVVVEKLSASTRGMLTKEESVSVATSLYATMDVSWLNRLCASEIVQVLARANGTRNRHGGHGGAMGMSQAEALESELLDMIEGMRSLWGRGWDQYELLLVEKMEFSNGQFSFESPRIMGANNQFERVARMVTRPMETGQLYLLSEGALSGLKLLPLIRVMASPNQVANACYFYNRSEQDRQRFVSYHFEQESEVCQHFEDTAIVLQQLETPRGKSATEWAP